MSAALPSPDGPTPDQDNPGASLNLSRPFVRRPIASARINFLLDRG